MKTKILAGLLAAITMISFTGCGNEPADSSPQCGTPETQITMKKSDDLTAAEKTEESTVAETTAAAETTISSETENTTETTEATEATKTTETTETTETASEKGLRYELLKSPDKSSASYQAANEIYEAYQKAAADTDTELAIKLNDYEILLAMDYYIDKGERISFSKEDVLQMYQNGELDDSDIFNITSKSEPLVYGELMDACNPEILKLYNKYLEKNGIGVKVSEVFIGFVTTETNSFEFPVAVLNIDGTYKMDTYITLLISLMN